MNHMYYQIYHIMTKYIIYKGIFFELSLIKKFEIKYLMFITLRGGGAFCSNPEVLNINLKHTTDYDVL